MAEEQALLHHRFPLSLGPHAPGQFDHVGSGLVDAPGSGNWKKSTSSPESLAHVLRILKAAFAACIPRSRRSEFTHHWGGPILFRDDWQPVFDWHPQSRNGIVLGAFAGHGVALSNYLGAWAAEVLLGRRELPEVGQVFRVESPSADHSATLSGKDLLQPNAQILGEPLDPRQGDDGDILVREQPRDELMPRDYPAAARFP